jgi:hypothetical protein
MPHNQLSYTPRRTAPAPRSLLDPLGKPSQVNAKRWRCFVRPCTIYMIDLATFADHLACYSVNGIQFSDGTVQRLLVTAVWRPVVKYTVSAGEQTTLQQLEAADALSENSCGVLAELTDVARGVRILAGECNLGGDGFVAVIDAATNRLRWLAWFEASNPFAELALDGADLLATSTLGYCWRFPLAEPAMCAVVS